MAEHDIPSNEKKQKSVIAAKKPEPEKKGKDNATVPKDGDRPKQTQIIKTKATIRKKSPLVRFREVFFGDDARSVASYVAQDVLLPAAKDMISDAVTQTVERILFGDSSTARRSTSRSGNASYTPYHRASANYKKSNGTSDRRGDRRKRASHDFDDIEFDSRAEAEVVLDRLYDLVNDYDYATVSDLYDLVGIDAKFTDENYGWYDLRGSTIRRIRSGYILDLPKPEVLE